MKRKIIQIANSTQLVSLPKKWCVKYGIKKGEEIEVEEQGNKIVVSTENLKELGNKEVDITDLDRDSLMYLIRFLYIKGYDEIKIVFNNPVVEHYRTGKKVSVDTAVNDEVNRLNGFEVIQQRDNFFIIKDIGESSLKDFDVVLRRILLLLIDASSDLKNGSIKGDTNLLSTIQSKHDTITKFIANNLRILNKAGYNERNNLTMYHVLYVLDNITDILKETARDILRYNIKVSKESQNFFQIMHEMLVDFETLYFKFDKRLVDKINMQRYNILKNVDKFSKKVSPEELLIITQIESVAYRILDLSVNRMMMEY